jgi:hypothetical protein
MIQIKSLATETYLDLTPRQRISFTIENPLFSEDGMPVSVSTGIEFPLTPTNMFEFGFVDAMMVSPQAQTVLASIILAGIEIFKGELKFDEFSDGILKYTFVETGVFDQNNLSRKIYEIESELYSEIDLLTFVENARKEKYEDFGLPMIIRKPNVAKIELPTPNAAAECSIIDKYANHLFGGYGGSRRSGFVRSPYIVPAVKVGYMLNKMLPGISLPAETTPYLQRLAIIGTYKPEGWQNDLVGIPYSATTNTPSYGVCKSVRMSESLPDMTCSDFLSNLFKMFSISLFANGTLKTKKSIINDKTYVDWSNNVSKVYSVITGDAGGFVLEYANQNENFTPPKQDDTWQDVVPPKIIVCPSIFEMRNEFLASNDYIAVQVSATKNVYSGKKINVRFFYDRRGTFLSETMGIVTMDIVSQSGLDKSTVGDANNSSWDNSIDFHCVSCIPAEVTTSVYTSDGSSPYPFSLFGTSPIIDLPSVGAERPSTVYIGLLYGHNMLDQGEYSEYVTPFQQPNGTTYTSPLSIAIGGADGLYEKFHKDFAAWITKKHDSIKADVFLEPSDIADLQLWKKRMIHNRLFFIKSMELTILDNADIAFANTEFIDVTTI